MSLHITPALLAQATGCSPVRAELFAGHLVEACGAYAISATPERLAAFLAQIGHESASLRYVAEVWGPTPSQKRYEGRKDLGNIEPGDGSRYRGRGLIQTTGRANYAAVRDRLRRRLGPEVPDFEAEPDLLEHIRWAVWSAADYWDWRGLNTLAASGAAADFERITRRINGGLNGQPDRLARWKRAREALHIETPAAVKESLTAATTPEVTTMPLPAILGALLPTLIESVPKLGKLFGSGSEVAERNVKAAELAMQIAQDALGARNAQEAVEIAKADPAAAAKAAEAIEARWLELTEAGGDGIAGARKADEARSGGAWWQSPSLIVALLLLPLVYILVLSLIGAVGTATWNDDVRAGLAGSLISAIVGGLVGYYYGQTTSRNRTPS
ncbi:MAG: glycoside hydrolase family 19 protein [Caldilineaceae bacterium]|nr:glycoside hydrolase family 19 protein [Caldilineaceae bacterium]